MTEARDARSATMFDRLCEIIDRQKVGEWQGHIHPEDVSHLARALLDAGVTVPAPPCEHGVPTDVYCATCDCGCRCPGCRE